MKKLSIYAAGLVILAGVLLAFYRHMQGKLNPIGHKSPPSRLANCQKITINDPKLIAFANKCLLEHGKSRIAYSSARNLEDITCPRKISDFVPEIKRYTESERKRIASVKLPDKWTVWYRNKRGYLGGNYLVEISLDTCECTVSGH